MTAYGLHCLIMRFGPFLCWRPFLHSLSNIQRENIQISELIQKSENFSIQLSVKLPIHTVKWEIFLWAIEKWYLFHHHIHSRLPMHIPMCLSKGLEVNNGSESHDKHCLQNLYSILKFTLKWIQCKASHAPWTWTQHEIISNYIKARVQHINVWRDYNSSHPSLKVSQLSVIPHLFGWNYTGISLLKAKGNTNRSTRRAWGPILLLKLVHPQ